MLEALALSKTVSSRNRVLLSLDFGMLRSFFRAAANVLHSFLRCLSPCSSAFLQDKNVRLRQTAFEERPDFRPHRMVFKQLREKGQPSSPPPKASALSSASQSPLTSPDTSPLTSPRTTTTALKDIPSTVERRRGAPKPFTSLYPPPEDLSGLRRRSRSIDQAKAEIGEDGPLGFERLRSPSPESVPLPEDSEDVDWQ
jgi:hypothetical protein